MNKGAIAFARHWIDVFNEAGRGGETDALREASSGNCATCANYVEMIDGLYSSGGKLVTDGWKVRDAVLTDDAKQGEARVAMEIDQSSQRVHDEAGDVRSFPGGNAAFSASLVWADNGWRMAELVIVE